MKKMTAVTKDIKRFKKDYLTALEDISEKNDTVIADAADKNTAAARTGIILIWHGAELVKKMTFLLLGCGKL